MGAHMSLDAHPLTETATQETSHSQIADLLAQETEELKRQQKQDELDRELAASLATLDQMRINAETKKQMEMKKKQQQRPTIISDALLAQQIGAQQQTELEQSVRKKQRIPNSHRIPQSEHEEVKHHRLRRNLRWTANSCFLDSALQLIWCITDNEDRAFVRITADLIRRQPRQARPTDATEKQAQLVDKIIRLDEAFFSTERGRVNHQQCIYPFYESLDYLRYREQDDPWVAFNQFFDLLDPSFRSFNSELRLPISRVLAVGRIYIRVTRDGLSVDYPDNDIYKPIVLTKTTPHQEAVVNAQNEIDAIFNPNLPVHVYEDRGNQDVEPIITHTSQYVTFSNLRTRGVQYSAYEMVYPDDINILSHPVGAVPPTDIATLSGYCNELYTQMRKEKKTLKTCAGRIGAYVKTVCTAQNNQWYRLKGLICFILSEVVPGKGPRGHYVMYERRDDDTWLKYDDQDDKGPTQERFSPNAEHTIRTQIVGALYERTQQFPNVSQDIRRGHDALFMRNTQADREFNDIGKKYAIGDQYV